MLAGKCVYASYFENAPSMEIDGNTRVWASSGPAKVPSSNTRCARNYQTLSPDMGDVEEMGMCIDLSPVTITITGLHSTSINMSISLQVLPARSQKGQRTHPVLR